MKQGVDEIICVKFLQVIDLFTDTDIFYRNSQFRLDGTTGQNAMAQAKQFMEVADITGIILTKLDGTAKGGIAVAIQSELGIPVKYVGVGEKIDDLQKFNSEDFVTALFDVKKDE